jgi:hypothetical protein
MARYEHLPIYKASMDLAVYMENGVKNMSRYNKYAIGAELRKRTLSALSLVVRANSVLDSKILVLEELRIVLEELRQLLFLAKETKALVSFQFYKTSQFFANVYLNELDQYCKRGLGAKYYIRYVDDFILLHDDPFQLIEWKEKIIQYLKEKLNLTLKEEAVVPKSVYKGIDFLGYFIKPRYTLVRRRVLQNYEKIVRDYLPLSFQLEYPFYRKRFPSDLGFYREFQARVNSYLAHFQHADSYRLRQNLEKKIKEYQYAIFLPNDYIRVPRLLSRFSRLRYQIRYYLKQFPKHLLIVQIGKYYEFYGEGFEEVAEYFQLKPRYRGNLITYGFPIQKTKYAKNWLKAVIRYCNQTYKSYILLTESDEIVEHVKIRMPIFRQTQVHPIQLELFSNSKIFTKQNKRRNKNVSK